MSAASQTQADFAAPGAYGTQLPEDIFDDASFSSSTTVTPEEIRDEMRSTRECLEELLSAVPQHHLALDLGIQNVAKQELDDEQLAELVESLFVCKRCPDESATEDSDEPVSVKSWHVALLETPKEDRDTKWLLRRLDLYLLVDEHLNRARTEKIKSNKALVKIQVEQERLRIKTMEHRAVLREKRDRRESFAHAAMELNRCLRNTWLHGAQ
ncbi:hypothetical protein BT96DRAFT_1005499 [Gymnopus androsaceus JB14]|uniref:Uncharacterized protein n=1 Tax=Gymnopus androsaceus JB14 TaxID=1447944 RepID=A0A6A4GP98_9AGAR|nr:hypothetical protein BT96DRAFT_1005499 [Gymnopus androsaceus JB14]